MKAPSPLRYSTISDFHKCQKYFELKHILGNSDGLELSGDIVFGTAVHLAIQDLFEGGDGLDIFACFWTLQKEKPLQYSRYGWDEMLVLGAALIEVFRDEHRKHFVPVVLEQKIISKVGQHAFSGTIDFVGTFKGVPSIVDWKTAAYPYDQYKLIYNEQIYGYVHLARMGMGYKAEQGIYGVAVKDLANPRWQFKKTPITEEKLNSVLANIDAACNNIITATTFVKNPGQCVVGKRVCPFFKKCYAEKDTKDGVPGKAEETGQC